MGIMEDTRYTPRWISPTCTPQSFFFDESKEVMPLNFGAPPAAVSFERSTTWLQNFIGHLPGKTMAEVNRGKTIVN